MRRCMNSLMTTTALLVATNTGECFLRPAFPFGAFSALQKQRKLKLEPVLKAAILLGYVLQDGEVVPGVAWALAEDFPVPCFHSGGPSFA